ncbi:MAG: peptide deformylase [Actinomycetota bacterium]|nr:peptide deformylase [Actinomycetota bacterium]
MPAKPIVLKVLLRQRHLQTHSAFRREYDRVAAEVDPALKGGWPSKAQFYRWISGELIGLPYADHCRILEGMFPGWKVEQLFQVHEGGIEFIPEPPEQPAATPTIRPIQPILPTDVVGQVKPASEHEPGTGLLVEYDDAELSYDGRTYRPTMRRRLRNCGEEPISRYLIRISVDRYPGSPEQSNELYRNDPLTWEELHLQAFHDGEPMTWQVRHDRDAFKELWLLFENDQARFPLYPGESTEIVYSYTVSDIKWGKWFQRAVRLPTRRLSVRLDFPAKLEPSVWGMETSMSAQALPFRTPITRTDDGDRTRFAWTTEDPPLHARYRIEWRFKQPTTPRTDHADTKPSETMTQLGIVQRDDPLLRQQARPFVLPDEVEDARRVVTELHSALERVAQVHVFGKGLGIAAPQIGIGHAAVVVRTPSGEIITLLNPQIIDQSDDHDEQYEGCLSFFDVRGKVPRPLCIQVEHQHVDGNTHITVFERGVARLVAHEIDHLNGVIYTDRMADSASVIPVEQYRGGGQSWQYA